MNPPHHPNDIVAVHVNAGTSTIGISSSCSSSNHNINSHILTNSYKMSTRTLSSCMHPSIYDSEHESGQVSSPTATLSFLSSSPTDVLLLSSSRATAAAATTRFQQSPPSSSSLSTSSSYHPSAWPTFPMSQKAQRTQNPIRAILDPILQVSNHDSSNNFENTTKNRLISLALGDPIAATEISLMNASASTDDHDVVASTNDITTSPLLPCPHAIRAVLGTLQSASSTAAASYSPAIGTIEGRRAIAQYHSHSPYYTYDPESDVIVANGCSGALELLLTSLLDQPTHTVLDQHRHHHHSILLVPAPGFPLYRVIAESHGATVLSYPLLPEQQWEVDLVQLQNIMEQHQRQFYDHHTGSMTTTIRGIVINNPSNPTGAVYTITHLQQIVHLCQQYCIPIIADEIYGDLIFPTRPLPTNPMYLDKSSDTIPYSPKFVSVAQIAAQMGRIVPVITASGIGKQFLLPGWRIGWICFQDNIHGSLQHVKDGAKRLAQVILGASHLAQVAIPALLLTPPVEWKDSNDYKDGVENVQYTDNGSTAEYRRSYYELMEWKNSVRSTLFEQSKVLCMALQRVGPCLQVIEPQGAMYAMVRIQLEYFDSSVIRNDIDFTKLLYQEENVVVLPGTCFEFPNSFRVVFCAPVNILQEGAHRIHQFCHRHLK